jgi:hypothetical protein
LREECSVVTIGICIDVDWACDVEDFYSTLVIDIVQDFMFIVRSEREDLEHFIIAGCDRVGNAGVVEEDVVGVVVEESSDVVMAVH